MGDRANVFVRHWYRKDDPNLGVYLYSHWGGSVLPHVVWSALDRQERWNDGSYLTRIIFEEMIDGASDKTTGYGISCRIGDNEHSIIVVDCNEQTIGFAKPGEEPECYWQVPFAEYIHWTREEIDNKYFRREGV
jgi:hypothetical protein